MKNFRVSRVIAAALALSIVVGAPGSQAWGQVAATVRPGSVGANLTGASGSITPATSFSVPSLSLSAPALSAASLAPANLAPAPSALTPLALAAPSAITPAFGASVVAPALAVTAVSAASLPGERAAAVTPAMTVSGKVTLRQTLSAAASDFGTLAGRKAAMGRLAAFFDGTAERSSVVVDAADTGDETQAQFKSGLGHFDPSQVPVLVTLGDPGSPEALTARLETLAKETGFRMDATFPALRAAGTVIVRGGVPLGGYGKLKTAPGVISVAVAQGRVRVIEIRQQAPANESLLRSGMRKLMVKRPMLGFLALLPLPMLAGVAFMGPVMGGLMLGGAAAVLKPWLIGTVVGMAASFSYLSPLVSWIPLSLRLAGTYVAIGGLAWTFYALVPGLPAIWLAANVALSLIATLRSVRTLTAPRSLHPVDRVVSGTETMSFLNLIGYQALLPVLILGGLMPLSWGILAVSTALALLLLIKTPIKTPALAVNPPSAPSSPEVPDPAQLRFKDAPPAPKKPAHTPFVPATRVIAEMEKLLKTDPAAALKLAATAIINPNERRSEVKIGAQRILDAIAIEQTLPHYLELLKLASNKAVQDWKEVSIDPWWYLQRTALKRLTREAATLKPGTPELIDALKTAYKDRNASVRLAAAETLTALGIEPGPEPTYDVVRKEPAPAMKPAPQTPPQANKPPNNNNFMKWFPLMLIGGVLGLMLLANQVPQPTAGTANPPAITQTIRSGDSSISAGPTLSAAPKAGETAKTPEAVKADASQATLDQIAADTKRMADAAERQASALEKMAKPKETNFLSTLFWTLAPILLMVWLFRKMMGSSAGGIQMKPKMSMEKPTTRFDDVAGIDESLVEVQEIIDFLRDPSRFKRLGARMPKGILMEGPPGTGKTLLARALAGETDASFISISGSDFVELYVGMGARRVRELFGAARANAPAIIFIDEIDAVGKKRGDGGPGGGGNDEREQTINQILKEMDGFDNSSGVIVVAATNRADTLDAALTRPGRFDRKIHVGLPEAMGREAILALHAKYSRLGPDVDLRLIARRSAGLSGAFLENVINEAALLAARRGADSINAADIDEAVDRATIGGKRSLRLSDSLKLRIGRHEIGHVAANLLNEKTEVRVPVNKVTIIPHGSGALGFAESGSEEGDKYLYTRAELEARLDTALGGLVAEELFYGEWSTGPGSDLESATRVARMMVQHLGMSTEMGLAQTMPNQYGQSAFGSETDAKALVEINKLLSASKARVEKRFAANKDKFEALVAALVEKETLSSDQIEAILYPKAP